MCMANKGKLPRKVWVNGSRDSGGVKAFRV